MIPPQYKNCFFIKNKRKVKKSKKNEGKYDFCGQKEAIERVSLNGFLFIVIRLDDMFFEKMDDSPNL
jgi:hypothetical protein